MLRARSLLLVAGVGVGAAVGGCLRIASEPIDYETLRVDACEQVCHTMDVCDPERFDDDVPDDCFERCMTLMPRLHEENQCGSRQILEFWCVGELTCDEFEIYDAAFPIGPEDSGPCVPETARTDSCSTDEPFDLDE